MGRLHLGALAVTSPAFDHGGAIPERHTADGDDLSPPLRWVNVPAAAKQLVLVCHDPDAPLTHGFTHWVLYGISTDVAGIAEGGGDAYTNGVNDFGNLGYGGPAPPKGHGTHHYYFHLYAIDAELPAGAGLGRQELLERIDAHIIEQARIVGTYRR
jgi:Raf kinase inhibitor-like YbhB/YbcL family protein